ncbi:MAG: PspC domain-containing protein [Coriobacteriales bacterium]|jgi:phage shock protein PspC (stress-responsive transcriptional regulator)|nr:PspC domain-containing protein [Coriobacteriales bacterium]
MASKNKLYRSDDAMIAGVCSGLADNFAVDASIIRIIAVVLLMLTFGFLTIVYIAMIFIIPKQPDITNRLIDVKPSSSSEIPKIDDRQQAPGAAYVSSNSQAFDAVDLLAQEELRKHFNWKRRGFSAAFTFGLMLVLIGICALLGTFVNWQFWNYWPLAVVLMGIMTLCTPSYRGWRVSRAGNGILLACIGAALQFWQLGWFPDHGLIIIMMTLWPVAVIAAGMVIMGGVLRKDILKLAASLLLSLAIILGSLVIGDIFGVGSLIGF